MLLIGSQYIGKNIMANSKRICKHCKEYSTTWVKFPIGIFCTVDHAMLFAGEKRKEQQAKQFAKNKRDQVTAKKETQKRNVAFKNRVQLEDIKDQQDKTQLAFNKVIKLEELWRCAQAGEQPVCISCSKPWTPAKNYDFAAGHYYSRGARSDLALNNLNVFLQCNMKCNCKLSANKHGEAGTHGFIEGLIIRLGAHKSDNLFMKLRRVKLSILWTGKDYKILRKWLNARVRYLTKELKDFNEINQA